LLANPDGLEIALPVIMSPDSGLLHYAITDRILRVYYDVRSELGHGFLEQVCHRAMVVALADEGLRIREEVPLTVWFRGRQIARFSVDLVVEDLVLVEVKAFNQLEPRHKAQMLNYLRASDLEVGLLLNFGPRSEFERFVYSNTRKNRPQNRPSQPEQPQP
jgi:GxxExxY protein